MYSTGSSSSASSSSVDRSSSASFCCYTEDEHIDTIAIGLRLTLISSSFSSNALTRVLSRENVLIRCWSSAFPVSRVKGEEHTDATHPRSPQQHRPRHFAPAYACWSKGKGGYYNNNSGVSGSRHVGLWHKAGLPGERLSTPPFAL